jgi:hypothetical protein
MKKTIAVLLTILAFFTLFQGLLNGNLVRANTKLGMEYIIVVANPSLKDTVQDFVTFKESQGFDVIVEDVPTIEQNYQGIDRVEKIRNFLRDKTKDYPKSFTLLIGEPYDKNKANSISTGGDIPMRYIWPPKYYSTSPDDYHFPTDFYYCDLKGDWDSNKNGVFGEKDELNGIDYKVTNYVGRIPFSDSTTVKKILDNTMFFLWKIPLAMKSLLATMQFADPKYLVNLDLAKWEEGLRINILEPAGFTVTTLYEKESGSPSNYSCIAPFNQENFNKYLCDNDIIVTVGHGGNFREVWKDTNNNKIVDSGEVKMIEFYSLDDLKATKCQTKIWFDFGCFDALKSWKPFYNKEITFVTADALLSSTVGVVIGSTDDAAWSSYTEGMSTLFEMLIDYHKPIGEWLYSRFNGNTNDVYDLMLNIEGDPSYGLFKDCLTISADVIPPSVQITSPSNGSFSNNTEITITGTVSDSGSGVKSVEINSNPATFTNNSFNATVQLEEGKNTITIKAIDRAGNKTDTTLNVIRDTTVPQILMGSPNDNSTVDTETISVSGSVIDENIDTVTINDQVVNLDPNNGFFDTTIKLQEGENIITISAVDKAGNRNTETITVYYKKQKMIVLQIGQALFTVNGISNTLDSPPVIKNNRTLLPIRAIIESLGGTVGWDANEKKVTVSLGSKVLELWIGKSTAKVNGVDTPIDVANPKVVPEIINGRTMLPLGFVTENLGCEVQWDGTTKTITITCQG